MEIAMLAIRPALSKLGELLVGELTLEKRVRKGIESLITELTLMHAALGKVAKVPPEQLDEGVKIWAGNVKELSYHMEDIIDAFMVRVEDGGEPANPKNKVKKLLKKTIRLFKKGNALHRISSALEEVAGQAKQLAELRRRYEQEMRDTNAGASVDPRMMALYTDVTELMGIEETRDELINMLIEGDDWSKNPLKMVSIVGFGGLGKTTLAKVVYDKIKVQFDCGAFVSVSRNPDMKKVFKDILYELDNNKYTDIYNSTRDERQLIDALRGFLKDKRYLIVIDDIWDEKAWQLIKCAFSKNSLGSRLITTTRIFSVSGACCSSNDDIYRMEPLSGNVARRLFFKRVFSHEEGCPKEFLHVSDGFLKKCGGIPLAIITIASILASKHGIKSNDQWYSLLNSIGRGLTEDPSVDEMKQILLFSYYDLPSHLKPCLLYLCVFPEDYTIRRDELIWRWIGEGFIHCEKQETSLYDLGNCYFHELINRSLIQPIGTDHEERVQACRVHDMVLDLIRSLSSEESFVTVLDDTERKVNNTHSKVRRLSIQKSTVDGATTCMPQPQMRSLSNFGDGIVDLVPLISSFQVLRVLQLNYGTISDVECVNHLLHLRYLGLRSTIVNELPNKIGKLKFLQTLNLRQAWNVRELPSSIVHLRSLLCLYVHENMKLPTGMGNLTSLEVLEGPSFVQSYHHNLNLDIVKELGNMTKLRVLHFECSGFDESMDEALVESLRNLHKLQSLDINATYGGAHGQLFDLIRDGCVPSPQLRKLRVRGSTGWFMTLPTWITPTLVPLLSYLSMSVNEPQPDDIRLLGMLPALRYIHITCEASFSKVGAIEMSVATADAFPSATQCSFTNIAAVPSVFPRGAMPKLKDFEFSFPVKWVNGGDFDLGMGHLPSLQQLIVHLLDDEDDEASDAEVKEAADVLRAAVADHSNHPTIDILI